MKTKIIICVLILVISLTFYFNNKEIPISNITISYADSVIPKNSTNEGDYGLIDLNTLPTNFVIDLRYATENNFAGKQFYPKIAKAYLQESTAEKLMAANEELYQLGYRIKIWDAYRPRRYQYDLRKAANEINPKTEGYIANPITGSHHNRGTTVDITLTDLEGREIDMPTGFDHFGKESSINYTGCTKTQMENRELLGKIMEKHGFRRIESEWWHFDDVDCRNYPLLDIDFIDLYE
jgi:D-alanyl-D-alanine dipeptidase